MVLFWKAIFYHFLVGDVCFAPYVEVLIEMQIGERGELLQHCSPKNTHVHKIIHHTFFHIILKILQTRGTAVPENTNFWVFLWREGGVGRILDNCPTWCVHKDKTRKKKVLTHTSVPEADNFVGNTFTVEELAWVRGELKGFPRGAKVSREVSTTTIQDGQSGKYVTLLKKHMRRNMN